MSSFLIFGGILIILQMLYVIWISQIERNKVWMKYLFSWSILFIGILFIPTSTLVFGKIEVFLAGAGITMIITALLTIPVITLYQERAIKRLTSN